MSPTTRGHGPGVQTSFITRVLTVLITRVPTVLIARVSTVHDFYSALSAVLDDSLRWHRCSQQIPFQVSSDLTFSKMTHLIGMLIPGPPTTWGRGPRGRSRASSGTRGGGD